MSISVWNSQVTTIKSQTTYLFSITHSSLAETHIPTDSKHLWLPEHRLNLYMYLLSHLSFWISPSFQSTLGSLPQTFALTILPHGSCSIEMRTAKWRRVIHPCLKGCHTEQPFYLRIFSLATEGTQLKYCRGLNVSFAGSLCPRK